jgi:hypothetical protein
VNGNGEIHEFQPSDTTTGAGKVWQGMVCFRETETMERYAYLVHEL